MTQLVWKMDGEMRANVVFGIIQPHLEGLGLGY